MPHQPILSASLVPDLSTANAGKVFFEPVTIKSTSSIYPYLVCIFTDTTTRDALHTSFRVPSDYSGGPTVKLYWDSTAVTTGGVLWEFDYLARSSGQHLGSTSVDQSTGVQATAATSQAAGLVLSSISLTAGNFTANELVQASLYRNGSSTGSGGDNLAAAVRIHGAYFDYTT